MVDYISIRAIEVCEFQPTLSCVGDYLSVLGLNLANGSKSSPRSLSNFATGFRAVVYVVNKPLTSWASYQIRKI